MTRIQIKWTAGIIVTLLVAAATVLQFGRGLEQATFEAGMWLVPQHPPNADVAVVGIDADALQKHGPWPWPRNILADLISQLAADKPRVIALVPEFDNPQNSTALDYLQGGGGARIAEESGQAFSDRHGIGHRHPPMPW